MSHKYINPWLKVLGYILIIIVLIGIDMGISSLVYGDPLCAIKHCIVVREVKNELPR